MLLKFGSVFVSFFIATMGLVFSSSVGISGIKMTRCWDFHRTVICTHIYGLHSTYAYILQDSQKESRMIVQLFYNLHQTRKIIIKVKKRISFRVLSWEILYIWFPSTYVLLVFSKESRADSILSINMCITSQKYVVQAFCLYTFLQAA